MLDFTSSTGAGTTTTSVRTRVSAIDHPRSMSGSYNRRSTTQTDSQPNTLTDSGLGRRPGSHRGKGQHGTSGQISCQPPRWVDDERCLTRVVLDHDHVDAQVYGV